MRACKFNIGDVVYYNVPESEPALIIDIVYRYRTDEFEYLLGTPTDSSHWVFEDEISLERQII